MATVKQEVFHAVRHFFKSFLVMQFCKVWFPTKDFFRSIWWRLWGHNPKENVEFHMGQLSYDAGFFNRVTMSVAVNNLTEFFYGESLDECLRSKAFVQFSKYLNFRYQRYDEWEAIALLWDEDKPGQAIIDWFCKVEGITPGQFTYRLGTSQQLETIVNELLKKELRHDEP